MYIYTPKNLVIDPIEMNPILKGYIYLYTQKSSNWPSISFMKLRASLPLHKLGI